MEEGETVMECYGVECKREPTTTRPVRGKPEPFCNHHARQRDNPLLRPVILEGEHFDWEDGAAHAANAVGDDGEVNWRSASYADPGVVACPECGVFHWREGTRVRCAMDDCKHEWVVGE